MNISNRWQSAQTQNRLDNQALVERVALRVFSKYKWAAWSQAIRADILSDIQRSIIGITVTDLVFDEKTNGVSILYKFNEENFQICVPMK